MKINTWKTFKQFVDEKNLNINWLDNENNYSMIAVDGSLVAEYTMPKDGKASQLEFEASYKTSGNAAIDKTNSPFANKKIGNKRLFRRKHGISQTIEANSTEDIVFSIPYAQAKITKAEIIGCSLGDTVNLKICDDSNGTYSTVPNYQLNQFGFNVCMPEGFYTDESHYDADLYYGMVVKVTYTNNTNNNKLVGINLTLHELV